MSVVNYIELNSGSSYLSEIICQKKGLFCLFFGTKRIELVVKIFQINN
jgi:hypothetical protein